MTNGKVKLEASASFRDGKPLLRLWKDGKEDALLNSKSPFWMEIPMVGGDGKTGQGHPAERRLLRDAIARGILRGQPEVDLGELDRHLAELKRGMSGRQ